MKHPEKAALRAWREKQRLAPEECARRLGVSLRTLQRYESATPEENHGEVKVWPVPLWLQRFVERGFKLPPLPEK